MRAAIARLLCSALLLLPGAAGAQPAVTRPAPPLRPQPVGPANEITIYRDRNFVGPAVTIPHDEPNLRLVWTVSSARVRGGSWQLCERPNYHGTCLTLSANSSNLGVRRVQSARMTGAWHLLGDAEINRVGWNHRVINIHGSPFTSQLRFCAERTRIRFHDARARFVDNRLLRLQVPAVLESGQCTDPLLLTGLNRKLSAVEVTATAPLLGLARTRLRLQGR